VCICSLNFENEHKENLDMEPFEEIRKVRGSDVDFRNQLKLNALFNYMSDAAWVHAEKLYLGYTDLLKAGYFWVLAWARVEMDDYPKFGDSVKIRTWPQMLHKRFVIRDFAFSDANTGKVLGRGRTAWLLVDVQTKRSVDPNQTGLAFEFGEHQPVMEKFPTRIPVRENIEYIFTKSIKYSDLDVNQHVNNARYVEFLQDAYSLHDFKHHQPKSLELSYLAECLFDQDISVNRLTISTNPDLDYLEIRGNAHSKLILQGLITW